MNTTQDELIPYAEALPRYRYIYECLVREISTENLKPGDRIPSEKEICEKFNVSRITSKKALEMLVANNLISRQRGKGTFVVETPDSLDLNRKTASFRAIALLIPTFDDFFGNSLIHSIQVACEALGYHFILKLTYESPDEEVKTLRALNNDHVSGILMMPARGEHYNTEILRQVLNNRPLVFIDRKMWGLPVPSVSTDNVAAAEMGTKYLLEKGHRHIAYFSGPMTDTSTLKDRQRGFIQAFANAGIPLNPDYTCNVKLPYRNNLDVFVKHLSDYPEITAVFAAEFNIALQITKALAIVSTQAKRKNAAQDFSILTFDYPGYTAGFPEIIFLKQDEKAIGKQAVEVLHRIIEGEESQNISDILFPVDMVCE